MSVPESAFLLALAAGVSIVPGALAWLLLRTHRPTTRERHAFTWLVLVVMTSLLVAAAAISVSTTSERFFERYLMIGIPLAAIAFGCWIEDGRPGRRVAFRSRSTPLAKASPSRSVLTWRISISRSPSQTGPSAAHAPGSTRVDCTTCCYCRRSVARPIAR